MPPSTRSAKSSASSTPVPIPRSPKRRRLSRNAPGALPARSSSPDELASAQRDDGATPRAVPPHPPRTTQRLSAAAMGKEHADVRRRRSRDDDAPTAAAAAGDDGKGPALDEESPDELGDEVHHFWRGGASATASRAREGGRAARMKAFAERTARRRVVKPEGSPLVKAEESPTAASPAPLQDGAGEGDQGAEPADEQVDEQGGVREEGRSQLDVDKSRGESRAESRNESRAESLDASRAESRNESRVESPREVAEGEERGESPMQPEEGRAEEAERQLAWEQEREREQERRVERGLARRAMFRPFEAKMVLKGHRKGVAAVKFSPDGGRVASCCESLFLVNPHCLLASRSEEYLRLLDWSRVLRLLLRRICEL